MLVICIPTVFDGQNTAGSLLLSGFSRFCGEVKEYAEATG